MAFKIATGTYTGDGNDNRSISGVGFQPDIVVILANTTEGPVIRTSANGGDATQVLDEYGGSTTDFADGIQQMEADGFQVGTHAKVNGNGVEYYWTAWQCDASDSKVGVYTGDGNDNRSISGIGFQPTCLIIKGTIYYGQWLTENCGTNNSMSFVNYANSANYIQDFEADGFQVGNTTSVNANGITYYYYAFKDVANGMDEGTYTGDGNDNRSITVGFQPDMVMLKENYAIEARLRNSAMVGDNTKEADNTVFESNTIQALEANGFQVGNDGSVNYNGATYYWAAWRNPAVSATFEASAIALLFTLKDTETLYDFLQIVSVLGLTSSVLSPFISYGAKITPDALAVNLSIKQPIVNYDFVQVVSALSLVTSLLNPSITTKIHTTVYPNSVNLLSVLKDPAVAYDFRILAEALGLVSALKDITLTFDFAIEIDTLSLSLATKQPTFPVRRDYTIVVEASKETPTVSIQTSKGSVTISKEKPAVSITKM